jgi:hypothetical protein
LVEISQALEIASLKAPINKKSICFVLIQGEAFQIEYFHLKSLKNVGRIKNFFDSRVGRIAGSEQRNHEH